MAVIALFDKSFLQALNVDEAVWFDHFFLPVVCPMFYLETLADLAKEQRGDRSQDAIVKAIAKKFPEKQGSPCVSHVTLAVYNLLGRNVPINGQIPRTGGRYVKGADKTGVVFERSSEDEAFARWQHEEFYDVERMFAAKWRAELAEIDLGQISPALKRAGFDPKLCRTFEQAKRISSALVNNSIRPFETLRLATLFLGVPPDQHIEVVRRWEAAGSPSLPQFAPYAAFVLEIEVFFFVALASNLISSERNSNRTDIAYLFYLPFCQVFVSGDKLHRNTCSLFLRADQEFVWAPDLKAGLKSINNHFLALPEDIREQGIYKFAGSPPGQENSLVLDIWTRHLRPEALTDRGITDTISEERSSKLVSQLKSFTEGETIPSDQIPEENAIEMLSIERHVRRRRGSWWQVPKDLPGDRNN